MLPLATASQHPVDSLVQAIWKDDGLWYNAKVKGVTPDGDFEIVYDGFEGETVTIPRDQVRTPIAVARAKKTLTIGKNEQTYTTPAGYVIPDKLKVDPSKDPEDVIAKKKRKIHALKSQQRQDKYVAEISSNTNKWQSFQQKFGSSKVPKPSV